MDYSLIFDALKVHGEYRRSIRSNEGVTSNFS